jgi:hypothetical protein
MHTATATVAGKPPADCGFRTSFLAGDPLRESTTAERRKVPPADRVPLKLAPGGGGCILLRKSVL